MTITISLLGTGGPVPAPDRAGPATLVTAANEHYLVDAGRGVLMRLASLGLQASDLTAVLVTHLHSDHITDLNDLITTRWITTFERSPLTIVGPVGMSDHVDHLIASLAADIRYRVAHHDDLDGPPPVRVVEVSSGVLDLGGVVGIRCAPTDHRPVEPSVGYRFDHDGASAVVAGDTVPCEGLDSLCDAAGALVHTVIRTDLIEATTIQRLHDTIDYHSSPVEAGDTAARGGVGTLVLTHLVPPVPAGKEHEWIELAATRFTGTVEVGPDLHRVEVPPSEPTGA